MHDAGPKGEPRRMAGVRQLSRRSLFSGTHNAPRNHPWTLDLVSPSAESNENMTLFCCEGKIERPLENYRA